MGRPRLTPEQRREWTHSVNFYRDEYYAVAEAAKDKGCSLAEYLRQAAKAAMEKDAKAATP